MKYYLLLLFILVTTNSMAAGIYCQVNGELIDSLTEDGHYECMGPFREGSACYLGNRIEALKLFKDLQDTDFNWDEEWIENIHLKGKNEISYDYVDGPNESRFKASLKVCK